MRALADNIKKESDSWENICTPFIPGYFHTVVNFGNAFDPTLSRKFDQYQKEKSLNASDIVNSLIGVSIALYGRVSKPCLNSMLTVSPQITSAAEFSDCLEKFENVEVNMLKAASAFDELKACLNAYEFFSPDLESVDKVQMAIRKFTTAVADVRGQRMSESIKSLIEEKTMRCTSALSLPCQSSEAIAASKNIKGPMKSQVAKVLEQLDAKIANETPSYAITDENELEASKKERIGHQQDIKETIDGLVYLRNEFRPFAEMYQASHSTKLKGFKLHEKNKKWFKTVLRPVLRCYEDCCVPEANKSKLDVFKEKCDSSVPDSKAAGLARLRGQKYGYYDEQKDNFFLKLSSFVKGCPCKEDCAVCYPQQ